MNHVKAAELNSFRKNEREEDIDSSVKDIVVQLRGNLATIRGFLHFLEIGQYKASESELKELHDKLDGHLEKSQVQLIKKLEALTELCRVNN